MTKAKKKRYYAVDPRLKGLVQKYCENREGELILAHDVVQWLTETHREYQRKNQHALTHTITRIIELLEVNQQAPSSDSSDQDLPPDVQLMEDKDYNSMNALILNSYREKKESQLPSEPQKADKPLEPQSPAPSTPSESTNPEDNSGIKKRKSSKSTPSVSKKIRKLGESSTERDSTETIFEPCELPKTGYELLGGIDSILEQLKQFVEWPLIYPRFYQEIGIKPPCGLLLHGPTGCGKTSLANAIACEIGRVLDGKLTYFRISAPELVSAMSGESEANIRGLFQRAKLLEPALIFIDEIDVICPKRSTASKEMERRIVAQLITSFDGLHEGGPKRVMVIGATNRADSLDLSLRRGGRFDREIALRVPDENGRAKILQVQARSMKLEPEFDFLSIARQTPGYVGADLAVLANEAASVCLKRVLLEHPPPQPKSGSEGLPFWEGLLDRVWITREDFEAALKVVQPSARREGFATIPNVTWADVGALENIRKELSLHILQPIKRPDRFKRLGLGAPTGVLLYGPPGCGKTLLAKAIANDCSASFISVKGPELLNKYVGESERAVRQVFERARHSTPCIIFFDELDALCPRRDDDGNAVGKRVVNQLLTEIDGLEERNGIFIIAATNRPDIIDPAMLRPQRLDKLLYVPLPDAESRIRILKTVARKTCLEDDVDLVSIARSCDRFSGADLAALVREAAVMAISRNLDEDLEELRVSVKDFEDAKVKVTPSVSVEDEANYRLLQSTLRI